MLDTAFPRDLVMIGVVFGAATLVWAGWGQERPPRAVWRGVLGALSLGGLALIGVGVPAAIRAWETGSAIDPGSAAFVAYLVTFWVEVVIVAVGSIVLIRRRRSDLVAPFILLVVAVHFVPLAAVFAQGVLILAAVLLAAVAVAAILLRRRAYPSFWCGVLGAPVFAVLGLIALVTGLTAA